MDINRLMNCLKDPALYSHHPKKLQFQETHGSFVVIAKPFVYKIKKPVNFGFMNYSTLELRKLNLERELSFNKQLASGVYLEVKPLYAKSGKLSWTDGRLVEWVLVMRYLPQKWFLDRRIQRGDLDAKHIDQIGQALAEYYARSENKSSKKGSVAYLRTAIRNNFKFTKPFADDLVFGFVHDTLKRHALLGFQKLRTVLNKRMEHTWRWCHGDLHLDHIHVTSTAVCIYDCIEFNDGLRWIDMANDLAFLAMDLDYYGRTDLARHLILKASKLIPDPTIYKMIDFYKTYRAMVRAKVESLQVYTSDQDKQSGGNKEKRQRAVSYFRLALDYAVTGRRPVMVVIMGMIGTGKSTVAKKLSEALGCSHINSDVVRKTIAGVTLTQKTGVKDRKKMYGASMTRKVYASLRQMALEEIQCDHSVVLDATYSDAKERQRLAKECKHAGGEIRWVELTAPDAIIKKRLKQRDSASDVISDARLTDFDAIIQKYVPPTAAEFEVILKVSTHGRFESTMKRLLAGLVDQQMEQALGSK